MLFGIWMQNKEVSSQFLLLPLKFAGEKAFLSHCQKEEKQKQRREKSRWEKKAQIVKKYFTLMVWCKRVPVNSQGWEGKSCSAAWEV